MASSSAQDARTQLEVLRSNVFLIRHGVTEHNANGIVQGSSIDAPLNDKGRAQALELGYALKDVHFDLVCSSGMMRARETADLVVRSQRGYLAAAGQPLRREWAHTVIESLKEMHHGKFEGQNLRTNLNEIKSLGKAWATGDVHLACPGEGGESPKTVLDRALSGLREVIESRKPINMLCVAHSRVNKVLLAHLNEYSELHMMDKIPQGNCCINLLYYDHRTKEFTVQCTNATFDDFKAPKPAL